MQSSPSIRVAQSIARPMHSDGTMEGRGTRRRERLIWGSVYEKAVGPSRPLDLDIMFTGYESDCSFESETKAGHHVLLPTPANSPQRWGIVAPHAGSGAAMSTKSTAQRAKCLALAVRSREAAPPARGRMDVIRHCGNFVGKLEIRDDTTTARADLLVVSFPRPLLIWSRIMPSRARQDLI